MRGRIKRLERTTFGTVHWFKENYMTMSTAYLTIRERAGGTLLSCWSCQNKFMMGDRIHLMNIEIDGEGRSNEVLCEDCSSSIVWERDR